MKYQISADQRSFFEKNRTIEFEAILSDTECDAVASAVKHSGKTKGRTRDFARDSEEVRALLFSPRFGQIASELSMKATLRYGLDELYSPEKSAPGFTVLQEERCIQGLVLAMMLCIGGEASGQKSQGIDVFPSQKGNATFFRPDIATDPKAYALHEGQTFLLLVWTEPTSLYVLQPKDASTHELKRLGYVFGDRLKEKTHPILWR